MVKVNKAEQKETHNKTSEQESYTDKPSLNKQNLRKVYKICKGNFLDFLKHILNFEILQKHETILRKKSNSDKSLLLKVDENLFKHYNRLDAS